jgi:hypothetical protein
MEQAPEIEYAYRKWHTIGLQGAAEAEFSRGIFVGEVFFNLIVLGLGSSISIALR